MSVSSSGLSVSLVRASSGEDSHESLDIVEKAEDETSALQQLEKLLQKYSGSLKRGYHGYTIKSALDTCLNKGWIRVVFKILPDCELLEELDLNEALSQAKANGDLPLLKGLRSLNIEFNDFTKELAQAAKKGNIRRFKELQEQQIPGSWPYDVSLLFARACYDNDTDVIECLLKSFKVSYENQSGWSLPHTRFSPIDSKFYAHRLISIRNADPRAAEECDGLHYGLLKVIEHKNWEALRQILVYMKSREGYRDESTKDFPLIIGHLESILKNDEEGRGVLRGIYPPSQEQAVLSKRARLLKA